MEQPRTPRPALFCSDCGASADPYCPRCRACGRLRETGAQGWSEESVAYDLGDDTPLERAALVDMLRVAGIPHAWAEGLELRVPATREPDADRLFDQLPTAPEEELLPEELSYDEVPPGGSASELAVEGLSHLFDAADRLAHRPHNHGALRDFAAAEDLVLRSGAPAGFRTRWWAEVQRLTAQLSAAVTSSPDDDQVCEAAQTLRDALKDYV